MLFDILPQLLLLPVREASARVRRERRSILVHARELMRQGDTQRFDIGLLRSTRILQLRLQLQRSFPDIDIEKEQAWLEFDFGETKFGAEQRTQRVNVEECAASQGARLLPAIEPVSGRDEAHPAAPHPTI